MGSNLPILPWVIYQDNDWLVVNKPTGIATHAPGPGDLGLVEWLALHLGLEVFVCSRLDQGTSGLLIFALNQNAARMADKLHGHPDCQKSYLFISLQRSSQDSWSCRLPLDGKEAHTDFSLLRESAGHYLYQAVIQRGRKHQIRRHAQKSGVAILGDCEYGGPVSGRLCLHCQKLQWPNLVADLLAPMPDSFLYLLAGEDSLLAAAAVAVERRLHLLENITDSFRVIQRGELPLDCAIDRFGKWLVVTSYSEVVKAKDIERKLRKPLAYFQNFYNCIGGVIRVNLLDPHHHRLIGDLLYFGVEPPDKYEVVEGGLPFAVSLNDSQHVGLFLDQRDSRARIAAVAQGLRVANLFSFTCSFSSFAVQAKAEVVFSVDLARGCLERGKENFILAGLADTGRGKFIKEDVRKWLARQVRKKKQDSANFQYWDLVICDPPVFASAGGGQSFHVEKAWPALVGDIAAIMSKNGFALFANNHQAGNEKFYYQELAANFNKVTRLRPPLDFPKIKGLPATVRIYWCEKAG